MISNAFRVVPQAAVRLCFVLRFGIGFCCCLSVLGAFRDVSLPFPAADDHVQRGQLVQDQALHPLSLLQPYEPEKEMDLLKLARMPGLLGGK